MIQYGGAGEALSRARQYSRVKYTLSLAETAYTIAVIFLFLKSGLSQHLVQFIPRIALSRHLLLAVYLAIVSAGFYILNFPLNFYQSFILEHKFSLSKQPIKDWAMDQVKVGLLSFALMFIIFSAFYFILDKFGHYWWLAVSLFWLFFSVVLARLTPVLIIPLFFKYKKISDESLRERIRKLAEKMQVKILDVFEIDFSKKTLKANAAFVGTGKTRRVILGDTLKDKYTHDEIEVILAHEFAHYRLKHLIKLLLLNSCLTVGMFFLVDKSSSSVLSFFGLASLKSFSTLPLMLLYFVMFSLVTKPFENYISRRMEKNADNMALSVTGFKAAFISMMSKLAAQNLADTTPHPMIKFFFFDHPPINERIKAAESFNL